MKTILIDARGLRIGTGRYVRELLKQLEKLDTKHTYIVLGHHQDFDPNTSHSWQPTAKNFRAVICDIPHYGFAEQLRLRKVIASHQPDLVHFWMPQQPLLLKTRKITTIHDLNYVHQRIYNKGVAQFELKRQVYKRFLKRIAKTNQAIITPTKWVKDDVVAYTKIDPKKVHVTLEGGSTLAKTATPIKKLKNKQFLLYVGQSSRYKGQLELIEALQELRRSHNKLQLVLVGAPNSYTEKLKSIVADNNYEGVIFLGFVEDTELVWLYKNCAAYVQSSRSEGFGLMNLEAMKHGAPVVSSNATCLPEVCGDAAHYFDPNSVDSMALAIHEVISDTKLAKALVKKGKSQVKKYSWKTMAQQTLTIYKKTLK